MQLFHTAGTIQQAHSRRKLRIFQTTPISGSGGTHSFLAIHIGALLFLSVFLPIPSCDALLGTGNKVSQLTGSHNSWFNAPFCQWHCSALSALGGQCFYYISFYL
jgi:hypothetical protein